MIGDRIMHRGSTRIEADSRTCSRIGDFFFASGVVDAELPVLEEITSVRRGADIDVFSQGLDIFFAPRLRWMIFQEFEKPPAPFYEQQGSFSRTMAHDMPRDDSSGDVGLIPVEREHSVDYVRLLRIDGPFEHGLDLLEELQVIALVVVVHGLDDEVAGDFGIIILVTMELTRKTHRLGIVDKSVFLPNPEIVIQDCLGPVEMPHGQEAAGNPILVPDIGHVVILPGEHSPAQVLLRNDVVAYHPDGRVQFASNFRQNPLGTLPIPYALPEYRSGSPGADVLHLGGESFRRV